MREREDPREVRIPSRNYLSVQANLLASSVGGIGLASPRSADAGRLSPKPGSSRPERAHARLRLLQSGRLEFHVQELEHFRQQWTKARLASHQQGSQEIPS
jgi:hypothetical protein